MSNTKIASFAIAEMREFASFTAAEQRYIRRSLDIGLNRQDAFKRWARDATESASIRRQYVAYQDLKPLRQSIANQCARNSFLAPLTQLAAFDLGQERIAGFSALRFLYERLLGARARPWLPSAFCGAAALPQIRPARRKQLLRSLSEAAATAPGWSETEPGFFPDYIEAEAA